MVGDTLSGSSMLSLPQRAGSWTVTLVTGGDVVLSQLRLHCGIIAGEDGLPTADVKKAANPRTEFDALRLIWIPLAPDGGPRIILGGACVVSCTFDLGGRSGSV